MRRSPDYVRQPLTRGEQVAFIVGFVLLVIGLALMAIACGPPSARSPHVYLIGDSVSFRAAQDHSFDHFNYPLDIHAYPGQRLDHPATVPDPPCVQPAHTDSYAQPDPKPYGVDLIKWYGAQAKPGDWIVVQLGTNDMADGRTCVRDTWQDSITQAISDIPLGRCVAWVSIGTTPAFERAAYWNSLVRQALDTRPCSAYIPWDQAVARHPGLLFDGVHPTPAGGAYLRELIRHAVACRCDQVPA